MTLCYATGAVNRLCTSAELYNKQDPAWFLSRLTAKWQVPALATTSKLLVPPQKLTDLSLCADVGIHILISWSGKVLQDPAQLRQH